MSEPIDLKDKKVFITGGSGFIGTALCEKLIQANEVTVYDNGHRNAIKYTDLTSHPNFRFVDGDIGDRQALAEAVRGHDIVIHLAAIAGINSVTINPLNTMETNLIGTYNLLEAVKDQPLTRFVFFSTSEVYGPYIFRADEKGMTSQGEVGVMRWTYSTSKLAAEHLAYCYHSQYGLPLVIVRPFNIYGPRQIGEGAVHKFVVGALNGGPLKIYGDGNQIRSWCYVDDLVNAVELMLTKPEAVGEVFNIGNPNGTITILGLAQKVLRMTGLKTPIEFENRDYPDVELRVPDIAKAERLLGFKPRVELDQGIQNTIDWYREQGGQAK